ncbi:MAG: class I SAM-dependent methyltransferase [Elusimicrobiota bacterium]
MTGSEESAYLERNQAYWRRGYKGYADEHIESFVFRPYGRIIEKELGDRGAGPRKLLDFGCGAGAPARFFLSKGFAVYGVDISEANIECCKRRMPEIADHFAVIDAAPDAGGNFWDGDYDLVVAIQSLYYFSNKDLRVALNSMHRQMKPGALIYATMIGTKCWCFEHSASMKDGLRRFEVKNERSQIDYHYVNFVEDENELCAKFDMFRKLHVGFHSERFREDEGIDFHYTYVGKKDG